MNKTYWQVWIFVGMIGLVPSGVWAQPPSTETQDLDELERRIDILSDEMDELKESGGASDYDKVRVHGYGELHFNMPTDGRTRQVDNHRFVLGVHAPLADWIHLNAEIDFEHAAQELEFEFGYLDFLLDPKYNVRAGVVLIPVGFLNEFHEPPLFWTVERPQFQSQIIPTTWNGSGGGFFGTLTDGVNYRLYVVNSLQSLKPVNCDDGSGAGNGGDCGQFKSSGIRSGRVQSNKAVFEDAALTGRVELTKLFPGLQVGLSFYTGNTTQGLIPQGGHTTLLEGDIRFRKKWFEMNSSYATTHIQNAAELNTYAAAVGTASGTIASEILGWNVQAGIHMLELMGKGTTHDLVAHIMYEFIDTQSEVPSGFAPDPKGERYVITTGLAYYPIKKVALKADFQSIQFDNNTSEEQFNFGLAYMF